jgi:hypothetical protein
MENPLYINVFFFLMGKSYINGPFSMAMLNNQRVDQTYIKIKSCCLPKMDSTYINVTNTTGLFYPNLESVGGHARLFADGNPDLPPS